jgi:nucleoside-diphosphate kinase
MRTLLMIKPDVVESGLWGDILSLVLRNRFQVVNLRMLSMDRATAERFYEVHKSRDFFSDLVAYITSGPVIAIEIAGGSELIDEVRTFVGKTDPMDAARGTIRFMYGKTIQYNAVHASDSPESAKKELAIVFGGP